MDEKEKRMIKHRQKKLFTETVLFLKDAEINKDLDPHIFVALFYILVTTIMNLGNKEDQDTQTDIIHDLMFIKLLSNPKDSLFDRVIKSDDYKKMDDELEALVTELKLDAGIALFKEVNSQISEESTNNAIGMIMKFLFKRKPYDFDKVHLLLSAVITSMQLSSHDFEKSVSTTMLIIAVFSKQMDLTDDDDLDKVIRLVDLFVANQFDLVGENAELMLEERKKLMDSEKEIDSEKMKSKDS